LKMKLNACRKRMRRKRMRHLKLIRASRLLPEVRRRVLNSLFRLLRPKWF